jgi:hypothetical protein
MKIAKLLLAALALALIPAAQVQASNYPPDYAICNVTDTVTAQPAGAFQLIRRITKVPGRGVSLTVSYRGYLRNKYPDSQIKIYVSLNGNNPLPVLGTPMIQASTGSNGDAYVYLHAGPRNCGMCMSYMADSWPECKAFLDAGNHEGQWLCQQPSALENHMFQWAFDSNNYLNAWDISVAAEANGEWDSNFGANYFGRFEPKGCW